MTSIVVLAGGVGGARFLRGVREAVARHPRGPSVTAVVNTGDDMWHVGVRITPDLDSVLYALAGVNDETRGWGREGETERVSGELRAWGVGWPWFTLGDLDLGTHLARTSWLREGLALSTVVERLSQRWPLGIRLLPMTDDEVETHVEVATEGGTEEIHFQEWWTRHRAALPALRFVQRGVEPSHPAPGVLDAIATADLVLLAPSNPVVSIGTILGVPGIRDALATTPAPIVGVSPIIAGAAVRGMADACLAAIGVATTTEAVARHYGARSAGGLLDGWLVDSADAAAAAALSAEGIPARALPLLMLDVPTSARIAEAAFDLGGLSS